MTNVQRIKEVGSKRKYQICPPNYTLIVHRAITNRTLQFFINNSRLASRSIFIKATEQTLPQPQLCLIVKTNHGLRLMSAHLHSSHEQFFEHPEKPLPQILLHETFSPEKHDQPDYFLSHLINILHSLPILLRSYSFLIRKESDALESSPLSRYTQPSPLSLYSL